MTRYKQVPMTEDEEAQERRLSAERSAKRGHGWGRALGFGTVNLAASLTGLVAGIGVGVVKGGCAVVGEAWDATADYRQEVTDNIKERLDRLADLGTEAEAPARKKAARPVRMAAAPAAPAAPAAGPARNGATTGRTVRARKTENGRSQIIEGELLDPVTGQP